MYGVTKKSKEETTLSGEALKEHSRIVHECSESLKFTACFTARKSNTLKKPVTTPVFLLYEKNRI